MQHHAFRKACARLARCHRGALCRLRRLAVTLAARRDGAAVILFYHVQTLPVMQGRRSRLATHSQQQG